MGALQSARRCPRGPRAPRDVYLGDAPDAWEDVAGEAQAAADALLAEVRASAGT